MNAQLLMQSFSGSGDDEKIYVEDVFSTYLYSGTGASQAINNGVNLADKGGLVWIKRRESATSHMLFDTERGVYNRLSTDTTSVQYEGNMDTLTSFSQNGFALGADDLSYAVNANSASYGSFSFRNAPKFFKCIKVTKAAGSDATIDLSSLGTVGMVSVKRISVAAGDWFTWHRSLDAGKLLYFNKTDPAANFGRITVSGTTLTLVNGNITDGEYIVYAWAHDTSPTGMIQCGRFATNASGNATVNLGWKPQYLQIKASSTNGDWILLDSARGLSAGADARLIANSTEAETSVATADPTATGFNATSLAANTTYIYNAIRKGPMRV